MNSLPLVSIVMPAYNSSEYLIATMNSVLNQSFQGWELIVIDDCSSDNTVQIVKQYVEIDPRIFLIQLKINMGAPAGPRNIGIQKARGEWIAFLDSDDLWHPEKLSIQISALNETGGKFCSSKMIDFSGNNLPTFTDNINIDYEWISFAKQLIKSRTPTSSVIVHRNLLLRHPFNEKLTYKAREDLDCWLHCHEDLGRTVKIKSPLVGYRIIKGQISGDKIQMFKRHIHVLKNYQLNSGRALSIPEAIFYTCTHFMLSVYYRLYKKSL